MRHLSERICQRRSSYPGANDDYVRPTVTGGALAVADRAAILRRGLPFHQRRPGRRPAAAPQHGGNKDRH